MTIGVGSNEISGKNFSRSQDNVKTKHGDVRISNDHIISTIDYKTLNLEHVTA